jgi:cyanophycin synthetase
MGVRLDDIRHGLRTFDTTFFQSPGRMNIFDQHGFRVIVDYGHNPAAVDAMCTLVDRMADGGALGPGGRRIVVLAAPGDRRNEDFAAIAARAARSFDVFLCRRDDNPRGRGPDEVPRRLAEGLRAAGVAESAITLIETEEAAVDAALAQARPGDLVLLFADKVTRTWKQVIYHGGRKPDSEPAALAAAAPPPPVAGPVAAPAGPLPSLAGLNVQRDARGVIVLDEDAD